MPSPAADLDVTVLQSPYVRTVKPLRYSRSIEGGQSETLPGAIEFVVAPQLKPRENMCAQQLVELQFNARLVRVQADFPAVQKQATRVLVMYPVRQSRASALHTTLTPMGEASFAFAIANVSNTDLGARSASGRVLRLQITPKDPAQGDCILLSPYTGEQKGPEASATPVVPLSQPIFIDIPLLPAFQQCYYAATLMVDPARADAYAPHHVSVLLQLGSLASPTQPFAVQDMPIPLQLSPAYRHNPSAMFVVVANPGVPAECIDCWFAFARSVGWGTAMWNTSLYGDAFNYRQKRLDGGSFATDFAGKVVVLLNNR